MLHLAFSLFSLAAETPAWFLWGALALILGVSAAAGWLTVLLLKYDRPRETKSDNSQKDSL